MFNLNDDEAAELGIKVLQAQEPASTAAHTSETAGPIMVNVSGCDKLQSAMSPKCQLTTSNFATRYKNDAVTKKEGRAQLPILAKEGKEEMRASSSARWQKRY